jgi:serine/threonine-protein kinase HipA
MRLANIAGLEVPLHGMIYAKDKSLTYFIKRFDRTPQGKKFAMEDFAQLAGLGRENKYNYSMEKIIDIIEKYCTFPIIEKIKLFKLVIFNFLTGNEDAHLKNFSLITKNNKTELSPCYDLLNTTISGKTTEEIALPLKGKKKNINVKDLIEYYGKNRLNLNERTIADVLSDISSSLKKWIELVEKSFLSDEMKTRYEELIMFRTKLMKLS